MSTSLKHSKKLLELCKALLLSCQDKDISEAQRLQKDVLIATEQLVQMLRPDEYSDRLGRGSPLGEFAKFRHLIKLTILEAHEILRGVLELKEILLSGAGDSDRSDSLEQGSGASGAVHFCISAYIY